ncbi:MAG TPA: orotate phosphoribosyltransferase [Flavobacteriales bacterium]|nr:orotate phosphoribosyltransferase [Flavobacteriales bacterium]HIB76299.1 orotate phosphoribosyltransferase [Flavobacteriales bacterium]HIN41115.1 orotate phosphoribosyltransferase [Flavobacteriales bacterium]HIO16074.1 orotate phosphoribosyltransferase [Flavobacteriales bacterium]HIO59297.1 orotate phosphoribosyltransferase [Flavobacteriales bacterium]
MSNRNENQRKVAEFLLQIQAVQLSPSQPFTWASGRRSPIYCDNRRILSFPEIRTTIRKIATEAIVERYGKPEAIAGVATGGIAIGALIAEELGIPFIYVRASAKAHGTGQRIEGAYSDLSSVFVIEDLISTGKSSLSAVDAIREAGLEVSGLMAFFTYGFSDAVARFEEKNCSFFTLTDYPTMLEVAVKSNYITEDQKSELDGWSNDPVSWSDKFQTV